MVEPWLPQDANPQQVWSFVNAACGLVGNRRASGQRGTGKALATCTGHVTANVARQPRTASTSRAATHGSGCGRNFCLLLGLLKGVGSTAQPPAQRLQAHPHWSMQDMHTTTLGQVGPEEARVREGGMLLYKNPAANGDGLGGVDGVGKYPSSTSRTRQATARGKTIYGFIKKSAAKLSTNKGSCAETKQEAENQMRTQGEGPGNIQNYAFLLGPPWEPYK